MTLNDTIQVGRDTGLTEAEVRSAVDGSSVSVGEADTVDGQDASQLGGESNVPGWEEDPNSPFEASGASVTYTLGEPSRIVRILSSPERFGHEKLRVNGVTSNDYSYLRNDDTNVINTDHFEIAHGKIRTSLDLRANFNYVGMSQTVGSRSTGQVLSGNTAAADKPIEQFTLFTNLDRGFTRTVDLKVYTFQI